MAEHLWLIYACTAALLWGLCYALADRVLQGGMPPSLLLVIEAVVVLPALLTFAHFTGELKPGLAYMFSNYKSFTLVMAVVIITILGNFFILMSIEQKNATLSSLIEISYPLLTFAFSWLLFRDVQLTWATAGGALLVLCGIGIISVKG